MIRQKIAHNKIIAELTISFQFYVVPFPCTNLENITYHVLFVYRTIHLTICIVCPRFNVTQTNN